MAAGRDGECRGQDRRTFIKTLGVLGGALAAGSAASAAPTPARTPTLRHSSGQLHLQQLPTLQKLSQRGPRIDVELPTLPALGEPPLPSTRQRLMQTLFRADGLDPADFDVTQTANDVWNASGPLTQVMGTDPLANAYAGGITLTPAGCGFTPPMGLPPIGYASFQSVVTNETFGQKLCLATVDHPFPGSFLGMLLNTPGAPQDRITYALELAMEPFDHRFECFVASSGPTGMPYESSTVQFVPTNEGTQIALVELRGSGDVEGWAHTLSFRRGNASVGMTFFNWLNVIAL